MTIYSLYIFDRHTECIYTKSWIPASQAVLIPPPPSPPPHPLPPSSSPSTRTTAAVTDGSPDDRPGTGATAKPRSASGARSRARARDDAKLVFGTVFSLRNMVRKLGGDDDAFISYRTGQYRLHYYETPANLRFVLLSDTSTMSMRNVLHQIYINLWVEYVVKNPLAPVEHKGGAGVRNELFELGLDQFIRGLQ